MGFAVCCAVPPPPTLPFRSSSRSSLARSAHRADNTRLRLSAVRRAPSEARRFSRRPDDEETGLTGDLRDPGIRRSQKLTATRGRLDLQKRRYSAPFIHPVFRITRAFSFSSVTMHPPPIRIRRFYIPYPSLSLPTPVKRACTATCRPGQLSLRRLAKHHSFRASSRPSAPRQDRYRCYCSSRVIFA